MFMRGKTALAVLVNLPQTAVEPTVAFISLAFQNQKPERVPERGFGALSLRDFLQGVSKKLRFSGGRQIINDDEGWRVKSGFVPINPFRS